MKDITIIYSKGKEAEYSLWSIFFSMIGVWVSGECIDPKIEPSSHQKEIKTDSVIMNFVSSEDLKANKLVKKSEHTFYFATRKTIGRNIDLDIIQYDWKKKNDLHKILEYVIGNSDKCEKLTMKRLFECFMECDLWMAVWLTKEIAQYGADNFNLWIYKKLCKAIECIESRPQRTWNEEFMILYCQYLRCEVGIENALERERECVRLIEVAKKLAVNSGWVPALCMLTADICRISEVSAKLAVEYYRTIPEEKINSDIYYCIGKIYEKNYGNLKAAMELYQSAYNCDKNNYAAGYKLAEQREREADWVEAIIQYSKVANSALALDECNTTQKLEYCIKCMKRIERIALVKIRLPELREKTEKMLEKINKRAMIVSGLGKQVHCMKVICKKENEKDFVQGMSDRALLENIVNCILQR